MSMRRRPLAIIASFIVVLGIIAALYFLLFADTAELIVTDDPFAGTGSGLVGEPILEADAGAGEEFAPKLVRITDRPVAEGVIAINSTSTTTTPIETASGTQALAETVVTDTEVRFIDRASGNIYRYMAHERSMTRVSNKTLPGIQQASWLPDGSTAYARFIGEGGTVATYVLPVSGEGGFFIEQGLSVAKATPSGSLFTLLSGSTGTVGSIAKSDGTNARTLFSSLLSSLIVHPTNGNYFGHTKASAFLDGYGFHINSTSGAFTRILGPLRGLSVLPSPDGTRVIYSYLDRGTLRLAALDVASRTTTSLPVSTMVEKCGWSHDSLSVYCGVPLSLPSGLPDFWYQGAVTFSDRLWCIDMEERLATLIVDPGAIADVSIDAVAIHTDPEEDVLLFTDRHNGSLWAYDM